ncbi:serine/threonine-protein kinase [Nostocoides sp. HKS02]|uniref:serine/threonine-protein kinase n=1 Tax=Nostocoides sp. HKS02 TaxID=1813880 RepID=UPI001E333E12|nr:protein kinase [Tetrasphaera sp. HKS02]
MGESVTVLAPVAQTLAGLHAVGVVHGDVSPGNVLLERNGRPLVADLGVARLIGHGPEDRYGTPGFVAPEVAAGAEPTSASDVYAAGALAWWCVTGQPPGPVALRAPLGELAPGLPDAWQSVTHRALAGDPALRPTATELAVAYFDSAPCEPLRLVVGTDETSLLTQRLRDVRPAAPPATTPADHGRRSASRAPGRVRGSTPRHRHRPRSRPGRRRALPGWLVGSAVVVVVVVGGAAGVVAFGGLGGLGGLGGPGGLGTPGATAHVGSAVTAVTAARPTDLASDRLAARRDPRGLLQALADRRAAALNGARDTDLAGLADLDVAGSPAQAADLALVDAVRARHQSYRGVRLRVGSAHALATVPGARATIDAVVDTSAYAVVDPAGVARPVAAARGAPMRFSLRWVDGGWRVEEVAPVPDGPH